MIKIENISISGFEQAVRGMRNPMNSWDKSDSHKGISGDGMTLDPGYIIGPNDKKLMTQLASGGPVHAKYRRMIIVWVDITAPLYWWKEFDTYKVGTTANSCSTMHKIHERDLTIDDFSHEHLWDMELFALESLIKMLNSDRRLFVEDGDKDSWWQMIQLLPSSYNQRRTIMMNYEVLTAMYRDRHAHKLDEWRDFCAWIETLPYSWSIIGQEV
jgi:hypothetical protein